jgi:hypothetical protein
MEMPFTSINGHPYLTDQCAALAIFNRTGSQRKVTIIDIFFRDLTAANSTTQSLIDIARISAYTGGEDILTPYNHDPNNASLPSQVIAIEDVDTVTATNGNLGRPIINLPFWSESQTTLNRPGALVPGATKEGLSSSNFLYYNFQQASNVQGQILREGQGICIMPRSNAVYQAVKYQAIIKFRNTSSGACYSVSDAIVMSGDRIPIVLFNGSGSGVVLEVYQVDLIEVGSTTFPYLMSVEKIDGLLVDHSEQSVLVSHDSTNESLTELVDYRRDVSVQISGSKVGAIMSRPVLIRDWQTSLGGAAMASLPNFAARNPAFLTPEDNVSHRILNHGEGIAVFRRGMSGIGKSSIMITFTVETLAGSSTYARNRVVNV